MIGRVAAAAGSARPNSIGRGALSHHGAISIQVRRPPMPQLEPIPCLVLITVNVFLALVSLAALIGIWFGPPIGAVAQVPPR